MKTLLSLIASGSLAFFTLNAAAATIRYVDLNSTNATQPFTDWTIAATNIQDAIDASADNDVVLVTNGIYSVGGKVMAGDLTNRVALDKALTVQSLNGPWVTTILGGGTPNGTAAVRCAWLTNGASLIGFTLARGATRTGGDATMLMSGGGVWCASSNAIVANCRILSNIASSFGGGAYQGTLNNCLLSSNNALGGGAYGANLNSCTVVSNNSYGVYQGRLTNCIVYFNASANYSGNPTFSYCCTTPLPIGIGNFTTAPQLFSDGVHLSTTSPCIGAGTNLVTGTDVFGKSWASPPSVGCAEFDPALLVTQPRLQLTSDPVGFTVGNVATSAQAPFATFWLQDGVPLQDNGHFSSTQTTNLVAIGVSFADAGSYQLVVSNASGVVTSAVAQLVIHCVDLASANPIAPYSAWATAATNIQDAIAAAAASEVVLVTNGLYAVGGKSMDGVITNRVTLDKPILVQSVSGPNSTIIQGAWNPTTTNGTGAVRCAWLTNNATLSGFMLRGGATQSGGSGGGVLGPFTNSFKFPNAIVLNCILIGNAAANYGGGGRYVSLINCAISNNISSGAGGGGADSSSLRNCIVTANAAINYIGSGGGADNCYLFNSAVTTNIANASGGGAASCSMVNCTITGNASAAGGGVYQSILTNCIVWGNAPPTPVSTSNYSGSTLNFCCTAPLPIGVSNITADPLLLPDGIHLSPDSPCIGSGANLASYTDIDGQPWNQRPSIGCDEWNAAPVIAVQPILYPGVPARGLMINVIAAGQTPFDCFWSKDGALIQDNGHYSNSGSAILVINNFGPDDAGAYQVIVSNAFGVVTTAIAKVVIHAVNIGNQNPVAPHFTWATAATNIQDAIDASAPGDIVLVTNGVYATGGKVMAGDLTNRVALDKPITVISVNGSQPTVIQGSWDPVTTNGPAAVRCAWLTNGAMLSGFTLQQGATRSSGITVIFQSGGGVWCNSPDSVVANCVLTNNRAYNGGGIFYGTLNNSFVVLNAASYGGASYSSYLNDCTVVNNATTTSSHNQGAGTYEGITRNSIVVGNYGDYGHSPYADNFSTAGGPAMAKYYYCCTYPSWTGLMPSGISNINSADLSIQFLDWTHIATTSPCRGAGNPLYASGTDLDGEAWANPPSIGCDEPVPANLVGPLNVSLSVFISSFYAAHGGVLMNRMTQLSGYITGKASRVEWTFGDGPAVTNAGAGTVHQWANPGDYTVTFTAFNTDNPAGVSTNLVVHVVPFDSPQLQSAALLTNGLQFQFLAQTGANYVVQFTTNLTAPITWQALQYVYPPPSGGVQQITDSNAPLGTRFYRVLVQ